MERDWSLKGNDAVSGRTAPATTPASPGGGTGGSWRIWNIFASSQPGWPIRPRRFHILWGARREIKEFGTYLPLPGRKYGREVGRVGTYSLLPSQIAPGTWKIAGFCCKILEC